MMWVESNYNSIIENFHFLLVINFNKYILILVDIFMTTIILYESSPLIAYLTKFPLQFHKNAQPYDTLHEPPQSLIHMNDEI